MYYGKRYRDYYNVDLKKLVEAFTIYKYHSYEPVFFFDFEDTNLYKQFIAGVNIDEINSTLCGADSKKEELSSGNKRTNNVLCVVKSKSLISIVTIKAEYVKTQQKPNVAIICKIHTINLLRSLNRPNAPSWVNYMPIGISYDLFSISTIRNYRIKHQVYSLAHNCYIADNILYLSIYMNKSKYCAKDLSLFLSSVGNLFELLCDVPVNRIYTQVDLHSPGNVLFVIENGVQFFKSNWQGLLIIFLLIFGGQISTDKFSIEFPSIKNFIAFFLNWKYNLRKKELEIEEQTEQIASQKLANKKAALELIKQASLIVQENGETIKGLSQKMNAILSNDNAPNIEDILDILDTPSDLEND